MLRGSSAIPGLGEYALKSGADALDSALHEGPHAPTDPPEAVPRCRLVTGGRVDQATCPKSSGRPRRLNSQKNGARGRFNYPC